MVGVVSSHAGGRISDADAANLSELRDALGAGLVGEIPPLHADAEQRVSGADLGPLLDQLGQT